MYKKNSSPSVRITEQELYELVNRCSFWHPSYLGLTDEEDSQVRKLVKANFRLMTSLQKPKVAWFHSYAGELFLFAFVAVFALTGKMAIEQYFSTKAKASQVEKNE